MKDATFAVSEWLRVAACLSFAVLLPGCMKHTAVVTSAGAPPSSAVAPSTPPSGASVVTPPKAFAYPDAPRGDTVDDYHGVKIADPYRWLEDPDSPSTRAWIEAENRLTAGFLAGVGERSRIATRLRELYDYERFRAPEKRGGRTFYSESVGLQNQPTLYVMDRDKAKPRVLLDPNLLSSDGTVAVAFSSPSEDGRLLSYGLSNAGSDWVEVRVRDVATGRDLPDRIEWTKFTRASWTADGRGFFYTRFPEPPPGQAAAATYFNKIYYHRLGSPQNDDALVYERPDQKEWMFDAEVSDDGKLLVVTVSKSTDDKNLLFVADISRKIPQPSDLRELVSTFDAEYDYVGNRGARLFLRTNRGAPRGRIIAMDTTRPDERGWTEIVPEADDALQTARWVGDRLVLSYLKDAHGEVRVYDTRGKFDHALSLPGIGSVRGFSGRQGDRTTFYAFTSFTAPAVIYEYAPASNKASVFRAPHLPFEPALYETEQLFATSSDGTRVPIFLTHRKGYTKDGATPTYLYGYGGFNISITPAFDPALVEWVEMGGVYAVATLRGGGEYGKAWHEAGMKQKKQNVFDDFMAAARFLVSSGYTRTDRLAIGGHSNGGLLVGACLTEHPELFGAALPGVGVMDMLRYHRYTIGWAWADEYGTSEDPAALPTLLSYSPLHNVKPGTRYPATLVTTADHDDRVVPAHSFKFAAALQAAQAGDAPALIRIETRAGHGGATPTGKRIEEESDQWAFLVRALHFAPWPDAAVTAARSGRP